MSLVFLLYVYVNVCVCCVSFDFDPKPKGTGKFLFFRDEKGSFRIGKRITRVYIYNPWETGAIYINYDQPVFLLPGVNVLCEKCSNFFEEICQ